MTEEKRGWNQRPWWLIGSGILIIGSFVDNEAFSRLLILVFIATIISFLIWVWSMYRTNQDKMNSAVKTILVTIVVFGLLYVVLSWIKCGDYRGYCDIFSGVSSSNPFFQ